MLLKCNPDSLLRDLYVARAHIWTGVAADDNQCQPAADFWFRF